CPLDRTTPAFQALEAAPPMTPEARTEDDAPEQHRRDLPTEAPRAPSPWYKRAGRHTWALIAIILLIALDLFKNRTVTPTSLYCLAVVAVLATAQALYPIAGRRGSRRQWLIVPGGLVLRRATLFGPGWQVRLFDRRRSVLFVHCMESQGHAPWRLSVADADGLERTSATRAEIDLVLRGWLSPHHPPPPDRLTDLT
ncbi:MAG TPA: hypothetical protein VM243_20030, partial [Phycisphaerae bacterium]|nr:hypothetical protein [Phycisphaerae bacterium]